MKLPLVTRFAVLSFLCVLALALAMGFTLSSLLTRAVSEWEWENTAAFARRQVERIGPDVLFRSAQGPESQARWGKELSRLFTDLPEVVRVKVWDREGTILWSDEPRLIGQRFPDNDELRQSIKGKVAVELKELTRPEHEYERGRVGTLAEVYVPIVSKESGEVLGIIEVYKTADRLVATIRWGRIVIWAISLAGGLLLYLVLLSLVRQVYGREVEENALRAYAGKLEVEVANRTRELQSKTDETGRLYGELRQALEEVEASQQRIVNTERLRALGEMAGGVAHDFNNTLAVILGRARLLLTDAQDPDLRRQLQIIEKAAVGAAQTVRRIQEFTRMRRGRPFASVDLNGIIEEVVKITRARWKDEAQAKGVPYDIRVEALPIPPVAGDASELREALTNILFNALDAMPEGGRVTFRSGVEGERVYCVVADTGTGMTEEVRRRIFDPFFTTKSGKGSGLGLSVAYGIVARHGGEIEVQSVVGKGSAFTIRLPVAQQAPKAPQTAPSPGPPRSAKILVIDDEEEVREILRDLLVSQGHSVATCADGESGLARLQEEPFDLLITDLAMPRLTGWQVATLVKRRSPTTPVALVTGWGDRIDPEEARAKGVDFIVAKPFNPEDLTAVLTKALTPGDAGKD